MVSMNTFEDNFDIRKISPNTWVIGTNHPVTLGSCDCYLLECDDCCVLIDSGMSKLNIHDYICATGVTDKPVVAVINTHSHFDHTGGNGYFPKVYMNPIGEKAAKTPFDGDADAYPLNYEITPVHDGDILEFAGRPLKIIEIGAHNNASIAIFDKKNRILFTGDELETGWCNISITDQPVPGSTVENHYHNMQKLYALYDQFDWICPGHHGAPVDKSTLLEVMHADELILAGDFGSDDVPEKVGPVGKFKNHRVMRYKSAHIGFNINSVYDPK